MKSVLKVMSVVLFCLFVIICPGPTVMASNDFQDADWVQPSKPELGSVVTIGDASYRMQIYSFGCGVYYFEYIGSYNYYMYGKVFGETLAAFIKQRRLKVASIAPNAAPGTNNSTQGYFVVFTR